MNGNESLRHINDHLAGAVGHADAAAAADHFPVLGPLIVIGLVIGQNWSAYRQDRLTTGELVRIATERGGLALVAGGAGWAVAALAHEPIIGLPISVTLRLIEVSDSQQTQARAAFNNGRNSGQVVYAARVPVAAPSVGVMGWYAAFHRTTT